MKETFAVAKLARCRERHGIRTEVLLQALRRVCSHRHPTGSVAGFEPAARVDFSSTVKFGSARESQNATIDSTSGSRRLVGGLRSRHSSRLLSGDRREE